MKTYIRDLNSLRLLRRNSSLQCGRYYLLQSESTGNTKYFEGTSELDYAKRVLRKHFSGVMELVYEMYTSGGFLLCVYIRSEEEVQEGWMSKGKLPCKSSRILSEILRYSISAIAKFRNYVNGRKGSVVRENFRAYEFVGESSFEEVMGMLDRGEVDLSGQEMEYRGWEESEELGVFDIVKEITKDVLRKINKTLNLTQNSKNINLIPKPPPFQS